MNKRYITFDGVTSLSLGLQICSERTKVPVGGQRVSTTALPNKDGAIVRINGREPLVLDYCFVFCGADRQALQAKARQVGDWLLNKIADLSDSDFPGKRFTNAYMSADPEVEYVSRNFAYCYMTVHITADPTLAVDGEVNDRVLRFTVTGNATLVITDNSAYSLTRDGTTETGTLTVTAPYKYRLVVFAEGVPAVTLNGDPLAADTVFTMPASAEIAITQSGYGYFELWHDSRTGVRR